jgi:Ca2+-binding RTX toxin-like protein
MVGGLGNDTYYVDNTADVVTETSTLATEIDTVISSISYTLGANVENMTLTGTAAINGTGNSLNNVITGNAANNLLAGGLGNDTYYLDNAGDVVTEQINEGTDTIISSIDYVIGSNVENLTITGTANLRATGNELNNVITGNDGNNIIDGGLGADTMIGGVGNDTFIVDNIGDVVVEVTNQGIDTVKTSVNYTLGANIENAEAFAPNGAFDIVNDAVSGKEFVVYGDSIDWANNLDFAQGNNEQNISGDCGIVAVTNSLIQLGLTVTEDDVLNYALSKGYTNSAGTTNIYNVASIFAGYGFSSSISYDIKTATLEAAVKAGKTVVLGVDSNALWGKTPAGRDNHAIAVTGVAYNKSTGVLEGFYIADSGRRLDSDAGRFITVDLFKQISENIYSDAVIVNALKVQHDHVDLIGNALDNILTGNDSDNRLYGGAGNDTLIGGKGSDTYVFDGKNNPVFVENANEGTDTVETVTNYTLQADFENIKIVDFIKEDPSLVADAKITVIGNDVDNFIDAKCSTKETEIYAGAGNDLIYGGSGLTYIEAGAGNDFIYAGTGNTSVDAGTGNDHIYGGIGNGYFLGGDGNDAIYGGTGNDHMDGGNGDDILWENSGGGGDDTLNGGAGNDHLYAGYGNNVLNGGSGDDAYDFTASGGNDTVLEDSGNDVITLCNSAADPLDKTKIVIYSKDADLWISADQDSVITVKNYATAENSIEKVALDSGKYMTNTDINKLVQDMAAYVSSKGIQITSANDIRQYGDLMNMVANSWHA